MRRLILTLLPIFLLVSCAGSGDLAYQSQALCFRCSYRVGEISLCAEVSLGESRAGVPRDATVTVLSPASLAGVTFTRSRGQVTVTLLGSSLSLEGEEIFCFLPLLEIALPLREKTREGDKTVLLFREGSEEYTVERLGGEALPQRITYRGSRGELTLDILP